MTDDLADGRRPELLLISGRSGVGKSTLGWEVSAQLRKLAVAHAIVEGDYMGQIHPAPADDPHRSRMTERNLGAMWSNFTDAGYHRLIYTNTVAILPQEEPMFRRTIGEQTRIVRILLTADDETIRSRLTVREIGSELEDSLRTSADKALLLEANAPPDTVRVVTDGRSVVDIAAEVVTATGTA